MSVNGYQIEIPLDKDGQTYDVPCLTTESDNIFVLLEDAGADIKVEGTTLEDGTEGQGRHFRHLGKQHPVGDGDPARIPGPST